jgi:hypothetical protein
MHLSFGNIAKAQKHLDRGLHFGEHSEKERRAFGLLLLGNKFAGIQDGFARHYVTEPADVANWLIEIMEAWKNLATEDHPDPIFPDAITKDVRFQKGLYNTSAVRDYFERWKKNDKILPIQGGLSEKSVRAKRPREDPAGFKSTQGYQPEKAKNRPAVFKPTQPMVFPQHWAPPPPPPPPPEPEPEWAPEAPVANMTTKEAFAALTLYGNVPTNGLEATKNYRALAFLYHPDRPGGGDEVKFKQIGKARDFLIRNSIMSFGTRSSKRCRACGTRA